MNYYLVKLLTSVKSRGTYAVACIEAYPPYVTCTHSTSTSRGVRKQLLTREKLKHRDVGEDA